MGYTNPGELFVERFGPAESIDDVIRYVDFLRAEAGLGTEPPIDLMRIYARFDMPIPKRAPLPDHQGMLVSPDRGIILIKEDDPAVRRFFTEAHELMEFLFSALPSGRGWATRHRAGIFKLLTKERLCNEGAAELLMPRSSFEPRVRHAGVSFQTARRLASEYRVSTTAALVRTARVGPGRHAVVVWRMRNKPTEIRSMGSANQPSLFGDAFSQMPPKRLRVEWSMRGPKAAYIPRHKSIPEDSSIYTAWRDGVFTIEEDHLDLGSIKGMVKCENYPFEADSERQVLSLLHLPGDTGCGPDPQRPRHSHW